METVMRVNSFFSKLFWQQLLSSLGANLLTTYILPTIFVISAFFVGHSYGSSGWSRDLSENGTRFDMKCEYRWVTTENLRELGNETTLRQIGPYIYYPAFQHEEVLATSYGASGPSSRGFWVDYDKRDEMQFLSNLQASGSINTSSPIVQHRKAYVEKKCS